MSEGFHFERIEFSTSMATLFNSTQRGSRLHQSEFGSIVSGISVVIDRTVKENTNEVKFKNIKLKWIKFIRIDLNHHHVGYHILGTIKVACITWVMTLEVVVPCKVEWVMMDGNGIGWTLYAWLEKMTWWVTERDWWDWKSSCTFYKIIHAFLIFPQCRLRMFKEMLPICNWFMGLDFQHNPWE